MENELNFDDFVETMLMLKALTIALGKDYLENGKQSDFNLFHRNMKLVAKFENNLDIERLSEAQSALLKLYTMTEIGYIIAVDEKYSKEKING